MITKPSLLMWAAMYAENFVLSEVNELDTEKYSRDSFIKEIKSKHGVKSIIRVWYWSRVYRRLVKYYTIQTIRYACEKQIDL